MRGVGLVLLRAAPVVAVMVAMVGLAPAARAATVWCALEDANLRQGFVTGVRHANDVGAPALHRLASRFRRTVNEQYGTNFTSDGGVCRSFPNQPKAESRLATQQAGWQARGFRVTDVGVF